MICVFHAVIIYANFFSFASIIVSDQKTDAQSIICVLKVQIIVSSKNPYEHLHYYENVGRSDQIV